MLTPLGLAHDFSVNEPLTRIQLKDQTGRAVATSSLRMIGATRVPKISMARNIF
jgi:hypothetical protein